MLSIRPATLADAPILAMMIHELAEYDRLGHEASVTEDDLARDGFGPRPKFRAVLAEWNGEPAGYAVFFEFYSTFQGLAGLFLTTSLSDLNFARMASAGRSSHTWPGSRGRKNISACAGKFSD